MHHSQNITFFANQLIIIRLARKLFICTKITSLILELKLPARFVIMQNEEMHGRDGETSSCFVPQASWPVEVGRRRSPRRPGLLRQAWSSLWDGCCAILKEGFPNTGLVLELQSTWLQYWSTWQVWCICNIYIDALHQKPFCPHEALHAWCFQLKSWSWQAMQPETIRRAASHPDTFY